MTLLRGRTATILIADDDQDDRVLIRDAFLEGSTATDLRFVENGEALMKYLKRQGVYSDSVRSPRPHLILLDLNMPGKNGRDALLEIKSDPKLRAIPVVVLTTSRRQDDILFSYDTGANSYITKPVTYEELVEVVKTLTQYWLETVELPVDSRRAPFGES